MAKSVDMVLPRKRKLMRSHDSNSDPNAASKLFMSMVPDDILQEILLRLPHVKYAIWCSLVSKQWLSLIFGSQFIDEFSRQNLRRIEDNNFDLFFRIGFLGAMGPESVYRLYSEKQSETLRLYPNLGSRQQWPEIKLRSSSLDLMVFKNRDANEIHVSNPFLGRWIKIRGPIPSMRNSFCSTGIATDRENFGLYKVVVLDEGAYPLRGELDIHVFCSSTRVWTRSTFSLPYLNFWIHNPISSQGVLYFPFTVYGLTIGVLVCSPLVSSRFRLVQRPVEGFSEKERDSWTKVFFGVVSGRLRVSQLLKRRKFFSLKIWELRYVDESEFDSDYSWVLVHDVSLRSGINGKTKMFVVAFHPYNGDVIFVLRDYINICRYHSIRGDWYKIVGQLPISNLTPQEQKHISSYNVKAFTLIHTPMPAPVGRKSTQTL